MKKLMNNPHTIEHDMFSAYESLYHDTLERFANTGIFVSKEKHNTVALVSGGGSGHEPADIGFVGSNMLQACTMGEVFIPPHKEDVYKAIKAADNGQGVFVIIKNFEEDVKRFMLGIDLAKNDGHKIDYVLVNDDCSVENDSYQKRRRGVAGTVLVIKILGAAAARGYTLDQLKDLANNVTLSTNTLGVALSSSTLPTESSPIFDLPEDMISYGIGIHGESGYRLEDYQNSGVLAVELFNKLKSQGNLKKGDNIALLVNGLGSTPLMELMVFYNDIRQLIDLDSINIQFAKVGNYMTSLDMKGVSISILKINDPQWIDYLKMETNAFAW